MVKNLCDSCKYSVVIKLDGGEHRHCNATGKMLGARVTSCTEHTQKESVSLDQMYQMAYHLEKKKGAAGFQFQPPEERKGPYYG